ncbi:MAG TPA: hypothetical protein VLI21_06770, partial [Casimicrobiaceae bacterium]|nr:hypothetical protein [Casimicrobiaceae bacterium]
MSEVEMQFGATRAHKARRVIRQATLAGVAVAAISLAVATASAQGIPPTKGQVFPTDPMASVPKLPPIVATKNSELADVVERFSSDQQAVNRRYDGVDSPDQRKRVGAFVSSWRDRLKEIDFDKLSQEGKADYGLLDNQLRYQQELAARREKNRVEMAPLLPFTDRLMALH